MSYRFMDNKIVIRNDCRNVSQLGYENKQQRLKLRHYHFTGITFYYQMTSNKIMRDQTMLLFMFNNICDFLDRNYCKNKNTIF